MLRLRNTLIGASIALTVALLVGCTGTAKPASNGLDSELVQPAVAAAWQPSSGFTALAQGTAASRAQWRAMHFKADLQEALRHFRRLEGRFPASLDELRAKQVFFHLPQEMNATDPVLTALQGDAQPLPGQIGVVIGAEKWQVIAMLPDAERPLTLDVDLAEMTRVIGLELTNVPMRGATALATQQAGVWAQHPLSATGDVPVAAEKAANNFLFGSDAWEEARVRLLDVSIRTRLTTYVQCRGAFPETWDEVLALTDESPVDYQLVTASSLKLTDHSMAVLLDIDREALTARLRLKPRVPAVDTVYLQYRRSPNGPGLERITAEGNATSGSAWQRLLSAQLTP